MSRNLAGCAHCSAEFNYDEELLRHVMQCHPEKIRRSTNGKQRVLVNVILDKSGSMGSKVNDTIHGFNSYVAELKKEEQVEYSFSLTLFDTNILNRHVAVKLADVKALDDATYRPGGNTALNDAIGITVRKVESDKPQVDKVITVIMTDGEENSSQEWGHEAVRRLIQSKEREGNWTFVFLGAALDTWVQGERYGIASQNVLRVLGTMGSTFGMTGRATNQAAASKHGRTDDLFSQIPAAERQAAKMFQRSDKVDPDEEARKNP